MAGLATSRTFMLIGQCMPTTIKQAAKVRVKTLALDKNLLMYFPENNTYYAHDPQKLCKVGDVVLIKELPERMTKQITHKLEEIVYEFGDVTDPVTGKKVVVSQYREEMDYKYELFGRTKKTFDYESAPPRGWQEGKKDFTDKETYIKYHVTDSEDPYAV